MDKTLWCMILILNATILQGAAFDNGHLLKQMLDRYDQETKQSLDEPRTAIIHTPSHKKGRLTQHRRTQSDVRTTLITAQAHGQYKAYNETILAGMKKELKTCTPFADVTSSIITDYAYPGWAFIKTIKIHDGYPVWLICITK
jgi:hypothetical protein